MSKILFWILGRLECRFCGRLTPAQLTMNGVCDECRRETFAWLHEMGCCVTWPLVQELDASDCVQKVNV